MLGRYTDLFWKFLREDQVIAQKRSLASFVWGLLATLSYYGAYAWIVWRAVGNTITLGDMTLYIGIFRSSQNMFEGISLWTDRTLRERTLHVELIRLSGTDAVNASGGIPLLPPKDITRGIEFRNVSFKYEGHDEYVLRNVNIHIEPHEKIALVGPNGAGKTTLIKL